MTEEIKLPTPTPPRVISAADKERARKFMLWLGMIAIVILFGGFTSAFIVRHADKNWFSFPIPFEFTLSTIMLLISSVTMILGSYFTRKGKSALATLSFLVTLGLGLYFTQLQWDGWAALVQNDIYFSDPRTNNVSGSIFYVITGMHLLHLISGLIAIFVVTIKSAFGKYSPSSHLGVKLCATYWHFLDGLWLYLFLFLTFADQIL